MELAPKVDLERSTPSKREAQAALVLPSPAHHMDASGPMPHRRSNLKQYTINTPPRLWFGTKSQSPTGKDDAAIQTVPSVRLDGKGSHTIDSSINRARMPRSWINQIAVYMELVETLGCLLVGGMDARVRGSQSKSELARGGQSRLLLRKAWATRSRGTRGQPHPTPIQGSTSRLRSINSPGHYQSTSGRVNFAPTSPPRDRIWCSQDDDRSGSALGTSRLDQSRASVQKNSRRYSSESPCASTG